MQRPLFCVFDLIQFAVHVIRMFSAAYNISYIYLLLLLLLLLNFICDQLFFVVSQILLRKPFD